MLAAKSPVFKTALWCHGGFVHLLYTVCDLEQLLAHGDYEQNIYDRNSLLGPLYSLKASYFSLVFKWSCNRYLRRLACSWIHREGNGEPSKAQNNKTNHHSTCVHTRKPLGALKNVCVRSCWKANTHQHHFIRPPCVSFPVLPEPSGRLWRSDSCRSAGREESQPAGTE